MAGEVTLNVSLSKPHVPVTGRPQLVYVLVEVQPVDAMIQAQATQPVNLSMVLDRSGSMEGEKIEALKQAVKLAINQMQPGDYLSVTMFNDSPDVLLPSQPLPQDKSGIIRKIEKMRADDGTLIGRGLKAGLNEIRRFQSPQMVSRLLLLTDGQTGGDEKECRKQADAAKLSGVPITALGIGDDWNEKLLEELANISGGVSEYIEKPQEIVNFFQRTVQSMQAVVVRDATMTLRLTPGVNPHAAHRVFPLISRLDNRYLSDRFVTVPMGELERNQVQGILFEVSLPSRPAGQYRIAQVELDYSVPAANITGEKVRADIVLDFTTDSTLAAEVNPRVMNVVEKVSAFKLQTRALEEASLGNIPGATQKLRSAATRLLNIGEVELASTAMQEADKLEQSGSMSAGGTKRLAYGTRKLAQVDLDKNMPQQ